MQASPFDKIAPERPTQAPRHANRDYAQMSANLSQTGKTASQSTLSRQVVVCSRLGLLSVISNPKRNIHFDSIANRTFSSGQSSNLLFRFCSRCPKINLTQAGTTRGGGEVLPEKSGGGVRPASQIPYPIYDQNLRFSLPYL